MIWAVMWFWLFGIFTVADVITTKIALSSGASECNPFMAALMDHILLVKVAGLCILIVLTYLHERNFPENGWITPAAAACTTMLVVVWNITQLSYIITPILF